MYCKLNLPADPWSDFLTQFQMCLTHHNGPAWQPLDYVWTWSSSLDPTLTWGLISMLDLRPSSSLKTCLATLDVVPGVPCLPHSGVVAGLSCPAGCVTAAGSWPPTLVEQPPPLCPDSVCCTTKQIVNWDLFYFVGFFGKADSCQFVLVK